MIRNAFDGAVLIDTSAVIALHDPSEPCHREALLFYNTQASVEWFALDVTAHESYTRARYKDDSADAAAEHYAFLRDGDRIKTLEFLTEDETDALRLLRKYGSHRLSFHDALCAAVMFRVGIVRVFTFDSDFYTLGFSVQPGPTRCR